MKLKPCPFCGSNDTETAGAQVGSRHVECYECGAWVPYLVWQQRHYPQDTTKEKLTVAIDALEEIAKKATFTEIRRTATEALEKIK